MQPKSNVEGPQPRVSVIMVFFNAARFIEEAILSVLAQTYEDWELLLVDDGSRDDGTGIAQRFALDDPQRIRYLRHPAGENRGPAASRNLGLREARGELIAFLDADDVYVPQKLAEQVPLLDTMPEVAMLYGRSRLWFSWNGHDNQPLNDDLTTPARRYDRIHRPPDLFNLHVRDEHAYPTTCSVLIRRDAALAVGGCEESFRHQYEDMTLFMKLLLRYPAYVASTCWDWYRRHPDACWERAVVEGEYFHSRTYPSRRAFLAWLEDHVEREGVVDRSVGRALRRELAYHRHPFAARPVFILRAAATRLKSVARRVARGGASRPLKTRLRDALRKYVPIPVRDVLAHGFRRRPAPPVGWVRFGSLRRMTPVSTYFGFERGTPIDRYYIEGFLSRHAGDVRGRVLEVEEDTYTRRFGGTGVEQADVLYLVEGNSRATIIADLTDAAHIPSNSFDCIILTQTLQYIYDCRAAVRTLHRILKPGGVVLATFPGIIQLDDDDSGASSQWSFTPISARRVFEEAFSPEHVEVEAFGNVLVAVAFLHGIAQEELRKRELDYHDPCYVVTNAVRAVKPLVSQA